MKVNDRDPFAVESLLEDIQFTPSPAFTSRLHTRLQQQLPDVKFDQPDRPRLEKRRQAWRWAFTGAAGIVLGFVLLVAVVPDGQARMMALVQRFGVRLPFVDQGPVLSTFKPLALSQAPAEMQHFNSYNQQADGPEYLELRYFSQDTFVVLYEAPEQPGDGLPPGEPVQIGEYAGVLEQNLSGPVFLGAPGPQPWRQRGSGGGGGGSGPAAKDAPPQVLMYAAGVRLTWQQSGLYLELLTNLPVEQALALAASLEPAPDLPLPAEP